MMALATPPLSFRLGTKQVFLPDIVVAMIPPPRRTPAHTVSFNVPLRFTKFDMRDYLFHVYGVEAVGVRSWLRNTPPTNRGPNQGRLRRPPPTKYMAVRLTRPFMVPERPSQEELDKSFSHRMYKAMEQARQLSAENRAVDPVPKFGAPQLRYLRKSTAMLNDRRVKPVLSPGRQAYEAAIAKEAAMLLQGRSNKGSAGDSNGDGDQNSWRTDARLDPRWDRLLKETRASEAWTVSSNMGKGRTRVKGPPPTEKER